MCSSGCARTVGSAQRSSTGRLPSHVTLQWLCVKKIGGLVAIETSEGSSRFGAHDVLELLPDEAAALCLANLLRSGFASPRSLRPLLRPDVEELDLTDARLAGTPPHELAAMVRELCPSLRTLNAPHDALPGAALAELTLPTLSRLELPRCEAVTDGLVGNILAECPRLTALNLSGCPRLTDAALGELACGGRAVQLPLRELRLGNLRQLTSQAVVYLGQSQASQTLEVLSLKGSSGVDELRCGGDAGFPNLRVLDGKALTQVPPPAWVYLLQPCLTRLTSLKIGEASLGSDARALLSGSTAPMVAATLDLSWVDGLAGQDALAVACRCGSHLRKLKTRCVTLDSAGGDFLVTLAEACPNLVKLDLSRCGEVFASPHGLTALAQGCRRLTDVDLSWSNADDAGLAALLRCSELKLLALQGCKSLTPASAHALAGTRSLRWVDLSWVNMLSEALARVMIEANHQLSVVDYYGERVEHPDYEPL